MRLTGDLQAVVMAGGKVTMLVLVLVAMLVLVEAG